MTGTPPPPPPVVGLSPVPCGGGSGPVTCRSWTTSWPARVAFADAGNALPGGLTESRQCPWVRPPIAYTPDALVEDSEHAPSSEQALTNAPCTGVAGVEVSLNTVPLI